MIHLFNDEMVNDFNQVTKDWELSRDDVLRIQAALISFKRHYDKVKMPRTDRLIEKFSEILECTNK